LGRPPKETEENAAEQEAARKLARQDEIDRNGVEGKFGNVKRKGTLGRVMAKLKHTSSSVINVALIVLNLDTRLREVLFCVLARLAELAGQEGESLVVRLGQFLLPASQEPVA
jgi:IS5 family transposase